MNIAEVLAEKVALLERHNLSLREQMTCIRAACAKDFSNDPKMSTTHCVIYTIRELRNIATAAIQFAEKMETKANTPLAQNVRRAATRTIY